ncbi:MAG TPA: hypothetical protein VJ855_00555 [Marinilabiliaceae bacterium]|nr:hypothetical protein [Marinilabiliaceae bacterium]
MQCFILKIIEKIKIALQTRQASGSMFSENVLPGGQGRVFVTDAKKHASLELIKSSIYNVRGVKDVSIDESIFPREIKVHTSFKIPIKTIQKAVIEVGFHVVPKSPYAK